MTIEQLDGSAIRLALRGDLDLEHAYTFDEELRQVEALAPSTVYLDLRELRFLDCCGVGRLIAARRRACKKGHRLVLVRGPITVQRVFAVTALDESFEMVTEFG